MNTDSAPALYEQAIDLPACSMGGRAVLLQVRICVKTRNLQINLVHHP